MAVAFEASGSAVTGGNPGPSSITTSFTVITSSANFLVMQAGWLDAAVKTCSSQAYGGVTGTEVGESAYLSAYPNMGTVQTWLGNPASGANNQVTTFSDTVWDIVHGFQSFTGADTSTQTGTAVTDSGTDTTPSCVVTVAADGMAVGIMCSNTSALTNISSNNTETWEAQDTSVDNTSCNASRSTSTGSVDMNWTKPDTHGFSATAWPIAPSGGGGGGGTTSNVRTS